jgi:hypothetical protein
MKKNFLLLFCMTAFVVASAKTYYVTPTGTGDKSGTSWTNALSDIQAAIDAASENDEIWVTQGTYAPSATLTWKSGVNVYGGFSGSEITLDQRRSDPSLTILDGGGSKRVVATGELTSETVWSGFTIQNGRVTPPNSTATAANGGGGILMRANATLDNCIVRNNTSQNETTTANNIAIGGGIQLWLGNGTITIRNCKVNNNTACGRGAGIMVGDANSTNVGTCTVNIENSEITGNTNNILGQNNGDGYNAQGPAIATWNSTGTITLNVSNTVISGNKTPGNGGGGWHGSALFVANTTPTVNIVNSTITKNAGESAIYFYANTKIYIYNSIFWENRSFTGTLKNLEIRDANSHPKAFKNNIITATTGSYNGGGFTPDATNITTPEDADSAAIFAENWRLSPTSTAINAGSSVANQYTVTDITGRSIKNGTRDIGAYEYAAPLVIAPDGTVNTDYDANTHGDVIFESNDTHGAGQWTATATTVSGGSAVKLVKTFTTGKWYSIGFPFDVADVRYNGKDTSPYLLQNYNKDLNSFEGCRYIDASKGYLIQFPVALGSSVEVTFTSKPNPTFGTWPALDTYTFVANPHFTNATSIPNATNYYTFNPDYTADLSDLFNAPAATLGTLKPFESVVATTEASNLLTAIGTGNGEMRKITVDKDEHVILITSPGISGDYTVPSGDPFELEFSTDEGYHPTATAGGTPLTTALSQDIYTLTLENVTTDTLITITTDTVVLDITIDAGGNYIQLPEPLQPTAKYFTDYSISFTLTGGYHHPYVMVDGIAQTLTETEGVYTVLLTDIRSNKTILIDAFAPEALFVTEDTYVATSGDNNHAPTANYATNQDFWVERTSGGNNSYNIRAYLQFDATQDIQNDVYNKVELQLTGKEIQLKKVSATQAVLPIKLEVRNVTEALNLSTLTWNSAGETVSPKGTEIAGSLTTQASDENINGKPFVFDITDNAILDSINNGTPVILLINAIYESNTTTSDGYVKFHSKENTIDPAYTPQLIFSKVPSTVIVKKANESIVNLAVTTPSGATVVEDGWSVPVDCNSAITFTFEVNNNKVPLLTVNGISSIVEESAKSGNTYTVTVPNITKATEITVTAIDPVTVTVHADAGVNHILPLGESPYPVNQGDAFEYKFSLNEGYTHPTVTAGDDEYTLSAPEDGVYTVTVEQTNADITITIQTELIKLDVTVNQAEGITDVTDIPATVDYFGSLTFTFKVTQGYHSPSVKVNDTAYALAAPVEGVYTVSLDDLRTATIITLSVATANVLPVTEDTYVRGGNSVNSYGTENQHTNYSQEGLLMVRHSSADVYELRSYLRFDPTAEIRATPYNQVLLRLVMAANPDRTSGSHYYQIRTAPTTLDAINAMTWVSNGETRGALKGDPITEEIRVGYVSEGFGPGKVMEIDVTEYILENLAEDSIRIQLAGVLVSGDMIMQFYAKESGDINRIPVLIFNALPSTVNLSIDENINLVLPTEAGSAQVACGDNYTVKFRVATGYLAQVQVNDQPVDVGNHDEEGVYTLTISEIKADVSINITTFPKTGIDRHISDDPVIEVHYYNLLGQEIYEPNATDIYITKKIHASKRVEIIKSR